MGVVASSDLVLKNRLLMLTSGGLAGRLWGIPELPQSDQVAHYMPCTFPMEVLAYSKHVDICKRSWSSIINGTAQGMIQFQGKSGIVLFFDEFYFRLFQRAEAFKKIFPDLKKRGEVLTKAMSFILKLKCDNGKEEEMSIAQLGARHRTKKGVRPFHFSLYCEVCLEVIMFYLGTEATVEVGESWTVVIAYLLNRLLRTYLIGMVKLDEHYQNAHIDIIRHSTKARQSLHHKHGQKHQGAQGKGNQKPANLPPVALAKPTGGSALKASPSVSPGTGGFTALPQQGEGSAERSPTGEKKKRHVTIAR